MKQPGRRTTNKQKKRRITRRDRDESANRPAFVYIGYWLDIVIMTTVSVNDQWCQRPHTWAELEETRALDPPNERICFKVLVKTDYFQSYFQSLFSCRECSSVSSHKKVSMVSSSISASSYSSAPRIQLLEPLATTPWSYSFLRVCVETMQILETNDRMRRAMVEFRTQT